MKSTLDELQAYVAVIDCGSISAAAELLEQTASAVSRALSRLEEKLDVTLLRRTTRRLEITEEGQAFLLQARKIIERMLKEEAQGRKKKRSKAKKTKKRAKKKTVAPVLQAAE